MLVKKNPSVDIDRFRFVFLLLGLILSLLFVISLMKFRMPVDRSVNLVLDARLDNAEDMQQVNTVQPPPPPPKKRAVNVTIVEVPDEELIEMQEEISLDMDVNEETEIEEYTVPEEEEEEKEDVIFMIVEDEPTFKGGIKAFYKYVSKEIRYPSKARREHVTGRVILKFVVEPDGKTSNVEVLKGIGFGCDEEAVRVLKESPVWNPGKQRGRPVRVRMILPVFFKLRTG
ncbi:MAG: energy transducer TonB [Cytophagales bacterium]|nr:energy transducer TonB [Cytophagales bacterium]